MAQVQPQNRFMIFVAHPLMNKGMVLRVFAPIRPDITDRGLTTVPYVVFDGADIAEVLANRFSFIPNYIWNDVRARSLYVPEHGDMKSTYSVKLDFEKQTCETSVDIAYLRKLETEAHGDVDVYLVLCNNVRPNIATAMWSAIPGYYRHDMQAEVDPIIPQVAMDILGYGVNVYGE